MGFYEPETGHFSPYFAILNNIAFASMQFSFNVLMFIPNRTTVDISCLFWLLGWPLNCAGFVVVV